MSEFNASMVEITATFEAEFSDFVVLYRGVENVWIGDGTTGDNGVLYAEMADGEVQNVGPVSSYYYALQSGYTGTFEQWVQLIQNGSVNAQAAAQSAAAALASQQSAASSASSASEYASSASSSATSASGSAANASSSATSASESATSAATQANAASGSASSALSSSSTATTKANEASASALSASGYASTASTKAEEASSSASAASSSATSASGYATSSSNSSRDSEAWAVGKRNGVDVDSSDPAYHNNAKFWANQASSSVIDDTATTGQTNKTWSADKLITQFAGKANLDSGGKVPSSELPSYVDDVEEYASLSNFPAVGESEKIYIAIDTNITYRWGGSVYVPIGSDLALGETSTTAYRGDRGKAAYDHATDSNKITTAESTGLYKISTTTEGHVASVTAVVKSDITSLGIPAQDTTYSEFTGSTSGAAGTSGLVPAPATSDNTKFLKGNGSWTAISELPTVSSSDSGKVPMVNSIGEWGTETINPFTRQFWSSTDVMNVPLTAGKSYIAWTAGNDSASGTMADTTNGCYIFVSNEEYYVIYKGTGITITKISGYLVVSSSSNIKMGIVEL